MPEPVTLTIPVAYSAGNRIGGININDEPVGFGGSFSPYMKNMVVERTRLRKRQGYSRLGTGAAMSGVGMALVSYVDAKGNTHLIAFTTTSAYEYNGTTDAWDDISETDTLWTGDADDRFSFDVVTDSTTFSNNEGSALCVVNNVNDVKFYEGDSGDEFTTLTHTFPSFASCVELVEFWNHLIFLKYTDSAAHARSLAWAGLADVTDWTGSTTGQTTLTDTVGNLLRAVKLGQDLIVYSERTISRCQYVGLPTIYVIPVILQETGLLSETAITSIVQIHYFLATDQKVYALHQSGGIEDIGSRVDERLFLGLAIDKKTRIASGYDVGRKKVLFAIPSGADDYAKKLYVVTTDLSGLPWEYYEFSDDVRGFATLRKTGSSRYCDDDAWSTVYCDETPVYCDDRYGQEGFDMTCFISSDGYVYQLDESTGYDNSSDIDCEYQTEDLVAGDEEPFARFEWFSFTAKSDLSDTSAYVYYSTDGGETFTAFADSPVSLSTSWQTHRLPLDVVSRRIRFKILQSGFGDLQLRSNIRVKLVVSTERD